MKKFLLPESREWCRRLIGKMLFSCGLSIVFLSSRSQDTSHCFTRQISFLSENDFYLFNGSDGYYTNGFALDYAKIHHSRNHDHIKEVDQFSLGQNMYTAYSRKIHTPDQIDRPVTGYLYLQFLRTDFFKPYQFVAWGISAGTIGKASLGGALQNSYHKLININTSEWGWIWNYQLKSAFGINVHGEYGKSLLERSHPLIQITPVGEATFGTVFTRATGGIVFQFGKMNSPSESTYWQGAMTSDAGGYRPELFIYYHPSLTYQLYDATVQGGLFNKEKGPIVSEPKPFVLTQEIGLLYSFNRYSLRIGFTHRTKVAESQRFDHEYGAVQLSYRFN